MNIFTEKEMIIFDKLVDFCPFSGYFSKKKDKE